MAARLFNNSTAIRYNMDINKWILNTPIRSAKSVRSAKSAGSSVEILKHMTTRARSTYVPTTQLSHKTWTSHQFREIWTALIQ